MKMVMLLLSSCCNEEKDAIIPLRPFIDFKNINHIDFRDYILLNEEGI